MANTHNITLLKSSESSRDYLVFIRTGDAVQFNYWDRRLDRTWDVAVSSYGDVDEAADRFQGAEFILAGGLSKLHAFKQFRDQVETVRDYRYVMLLDDDIGIDHHALKEFLEIMDQRAIGLGQPALTHDSHASWEITYRCPALQLRYTNFVEVMAPCFSRDALEQVIHTFDESISAYGLDMVWPRLLEDFHIAIVDACPMQHTRPVDQQDGDFYRYLASMGIVPDDEARALYSKYDIDACVMKTLDVVARTYRTKI